MRWGKMGKTYFWLKIQEDFYRQKEMKILRQMERGAIYIIIYQKMLIYSLKNGNRLFYDNLKDTFEEELALIIDEDVEDVKATVEFLKRANFMEYISEDEYALTQVEELTGSENESTRRVRKHREKKKLEEESKRADGCEVKIGEEDKKADDDEGKIDEDKERANKIVDDENIVDNGEVKIGKDDKRADNGDKKVDKNNKNKNDNNHNETKKNKNYNKQNKSLDNKSDNYKDDETFCNKNVTTDIELEKDLDLELDTELHTDIEKDPKLDLHKSSRENQKPQNPSDKNQVSMCVGKSVSENLSSIIKLYEENIGPIYPAHRQYFVDISEKIHWSLFKKAIEICIDKSNMTPAYLKGIIKKWQNKNIYTLDDLKAKEAEIHNKNNYKNKFPVENNMKKPLENNLGNKYPVYDAIDLDMLREMEELERKLGVN